MSAMDAVTETVPPSNPEPLAPPTTIDPSPPSQPRVAPGDIVRSLVGRPVGVRLADGTEYRGVLVCVDGFMNVAMEQAEEYTDGSLKAKLGDCFIRGNNGKEPTP